MKSIRLSLSGLLAAMLLAPVAALAQLPTSGSPTGLNAAFVKLFGNVSAFSARLDTRVFDSSNKEMVNMPIQFATLDNKVRMDINLEQMTSRDLQAGVITGLKNAGMSRIVSIFRPDKKETLILYPNARKYMSMALVEGETAALQKGLQVEKTTLGKEKVDGQACVKNKVVIKGDQGTVLEATTWNAPDMKDLPIQIETQQKDKRVIMRFTQIQFAKPSPKEFDVPSDYVLLEQK